MTSVGVWGQLLRIGALDPQRNQRVHISQPCWEGPCYDTFRKTPSFRRNSAAWISLIPCCKYLRILTWMFCSRSEAQQWVCDDIRRRHHEFLLISQIDGCLRVPQSQDSSSLPLFLLFVTELKSPNTNFVSLTFVGEFKFRFSSNCVLSSLHCKMLWQQKLKTQANITSLMSAGQRSLLGSFGW